MKAHEKLAAEIATAAWNAHSAGFRSIEIRCPPRRIPTVCRAIDAAGVIIPGLCCDSSTVEDWAQDYPYSDRFVPRFFVALFPDSQDWETAADSVSPDTLFA